MKNKTKTNEQLLKEIDLLKAKISELEKSEAKYKQTVKMLQEKDNKYQLMEANTLDVIWTTDLNHNITYIKGAIFNLLGYTPEEFVGLNQTVFITQEGLLNIQKAVEKLHSRYKKGILSKITVEVQQIRKDGKLIDVELTGNYLVDENNEIIGYQGRSIDISERKQIEKKRYEAERRLEAIFNHRFQLTGLLDADGKLRIANENVCNMVGVELSELTGKYLWQLPHWAHSKEEQQKVKDSVQKVKKGKSISFETTHINYKGEILDIDFSLTPVLDNNSNLMYIIPEGKDITEQKQAEEALKSSEERLSKVFLNNPIPIYITSIPEGVFIDVNPMVEKISGYTKDEMIGKTSMDLDFYEKPEDRDKLMYRLQKDGKLYDYDITFRVKSGESRFCRVFSEIIEIQGKPYLLSMIHDNTDRKMIENAIKSSEERLRILFKFAPDAYYLNDLKGNFVDANIAAEDMLGYKKEELVGKNLLKLNLLSSKQIVKATKLLAKGALGKGTGPDEFTLNRKDGTTIDTEIRTFPVKIDNKIVVLGIARDITERKKAEEVLRKSEDKYRAIFESLQDVYYRADIKGQITIISPSVSTQAGYDPEDIIGHKVTDFYFNPSDREIFETKLKKFGIINDYELQIKAKDGRVIEVSISSKIIYGEDGSPIGIQGLLRDITERKRGEEALRESEEKYSTLVENSKDGIILIQEGLLKYVNKATVDLMGYTQKEMIGENFLKFVKPDYQNLVFQRYKDRMEGKKVTSIYEIEIIRKGGKTKPIEINAAQIEMGVKPTDLAFIRDITERKKSENALKESEQLNKAVIENSPIGISVRDINGTLLLSNRAWQNLWGFSEKEITNYKKTRKKLAFNDKDSYLGEHLNKVKEIYETGGEYYIPELKLSHHKKNKADWISQYFYAITGNEGNVERVVILTEDITDRVNAQQELRDTKEKFQTIIQNLTEGFYNVTLDGTILDYNVEFVKILGLDPNVDYKGRKTPNYWVDPSDRQIYIEEIQSKGVIKKYKINAKMMNGEKIILQFNSRLITNESGDPDRIEGTFIDITDLKLAEEELQKREAQQALVLKSLPMAFYIAQPFGDYGGTWVSEQIGPVSGFTAEQFMNDISLWASRLHPDDKDRVLAEFDKVPVNESIKIEYRWKASDGKYLWFLDSGVLIRDKNGKPYEIIGTWLDITERKKTNERIKKDLKIKTALLQEIYHRTKNNMQVISSMLKIQSRNLENRTLTKNEGIDFLHDSFNDVINKIKSMSLVHEKLYQANDLSHINLKEYIEDLVRYLMISYNIRSEKVILKLELEDVFVLIDSAIPLGLVLNEMISNVFKHAFPHTKNDELSVKLYKEKNETINIHLADNGIGIPSDIALENANTMGLQTVFSLVEYQLMGVVKYDTKKGLKWYISFKDDLHKERV